MAGPYDARDALIDNFPTATEADIDDVARTLEGAATEWSGKYERDMRYPLLGQKRAMFVH